MAIQIISECGFPCEIPGCRIKRTHRHILCGEAQMKAYILSEDDLQRLFDAIDRDPRHGMSGGSSKSLSETEQRAYTDAHQFYNFQVRRWAESVKK